MQSSVTDGIRGTDGHDRCIRWRGGGRAGVGRPDLRDRLRDRLRGVGDRRAGGHRRQARRRARHHGERHGGGAGARLDLRRQGARREVRRARRDPQGGRRSVHPRALRRGAEGRRGVRLGQRRGRAPQVPDRPRLQRGAHARGGELRRDQQVQGGSGPPARALPGAAPDLRGLAEGHDRERRDAGHGARLAARAGGREPGAGGRAVRVLRRQHRVQDRRPGRRRVGSRAAAARRDPARGADRNGGSAPGAPPSGGVPPRRDPPGGPRAA